MSSEPQGPEGPRTITWIIGALIFAALLFLVFFIWYQNTAHLH